MLTNVKNIKGRGTANKIDSRYLQYQREEFADEWDFSVDTTSTKTTISDEKVRTIISRTRRLAYFSNYLLTPIGVVNMVATIAMQDPLMPILIYHHGLISKQNCLPRPMPLSRCKMN